MGTTGLNPSQFPFHLFSSRGRFLSIIPLTDDDTSLVDIGEVLEDKEKFKQDEKRPNKNNLVLNLCSKIHSIWKTK